MTDLDKVPVPSGGNGVNQPETPYGDIATLERLKSQLGPPGGQAGAMPPPGEAPPPDPISGVPPAGNPGGGGRESPLPGLPAGILNPSDRPNEPVDNELAGAIGDGVSGAAAATGAQRRLQVIMALSQSDDPEVREWAQMVMELLIGGE